MIVKYYSQFDKPQASFPYPAPKYEDATGEKAGCAPTTFSMVCASYVNPDYTPIDAMKDSLAFGTRVSGGTLDSFFKKAAAKYKIPYVYSEKLLTFTQALKDGKIVACHMLSWFAPGKGHFILAVGIENGMIKIHDPASRANTAKLWEPAIFEKKCTAYHIFTDPKKYGIVTASSLYVRSGAGILFKVIGALKQGERVQILDSMNGWAKIDFKGKQGFVSEKYLRKE